MHPKNSILHYQAVVFQQKKDVERDWRWLAAWQFCLSNHSTPNRGNQLYVCETKKGTQISDDQTMQLRIKQ